MSLLTRWVQFLPLLLALVVAQVYAADDTSPRLSRRVGFEIEYAMGKATKKKLGAVDQAKALVLSLKVPGKTIHTEEWTKYPSTQTLWQASVLDAKGRMWYSVPEQVESGRFDGRELITPPLETSADIDLLAKVREEVESGEQFIRGYKSAIHVNLEVADLISADGDASKLANVILFIEQNWPLIYRIVRPSRYGTIVNHFAVPLSANQPQLLKQIAALPVEKRTFTELRKIMLSGLGREQMLSDKNEVRPWKFRAANYGKLFGLNEPKKNLTRSPLAIIEHRTPDFMDMKQLRRVHRFLAAIIDYAAQLPPITDFETPFAGFSIEPVNETTDFSYLNEIISSVPESEARAFEERVLRSRCDYYLN